MQAILTLFLEFGKTEEWTHIFRTRSLPEESPNYFESKLRLHFLEADLALSEVTVVLSSVVPPLTYLTVAVC